MWNAACQGGRLYRFTVSLALGISFLAAPIVAQSPLEQAAAAIKEKDHQRALAILNPVAEAGSLDPRIWTLRAMAFSGAGDRDQALQSYGKALELKPDYLPALMGSAEIEFQTRGPNAQSRLERILSLQEDNLTAHAMMGMLLSEKEDYAAAVGHFRKSDPVNRDNPVALWSYGQCLLRVRQAEDSVGVFQRLLELRPGNEQALYGLGIAYYDTGRLKQAIEVLVPLANGKEPASAVLTLTAEALEAEHRTPEALETLQKAVKLYPYEELHYVSLADLCMEHGSYHLGLEVLETGQRNIPDSARIRAMKGVILAQLGHYDRAEIEFEEAKRLNPKERSATIGQTLTLQETGRVEESIRILRDQLAKSPNDAAASFLLAQALIKKGVSPGDPEFDEARHALERAVEANPHEVAPQVELGKLLAKNGEIEQAARHFEAAAEADPADRTATYQLMRAYRKLDRAEEAERLLQRLQEQLEEGMEEDVQTNRYRVVKTGEQ